MNLFLKNLRLIFIGVLIIAAVWFYKDYQHQKNENKRQAENASQLRKSDSLRFTSQVLSTAEIKDYLEYQNPELKKKIEKNNIKLNRIESIVSQKYSYSDNVRSETDVSEIIESIKNAVPKEQSWIDTSKCLTIKGSVYFDGQKLKVIVDKRGFENNSDAVAYWQRREWKFLGIKTRLFGKKEFTSQQFDDCGESITMKIEKKK